jgi:hypothetical protein
MREGRHLNAMEGVVVSEVVYGCTHHEDSCCYGRVKRDRKSLCSALC